MSAQTEIKAEHTSIAMALATAQAKMGKALKSANNPHFGKRYADLASVVDACMPALNDVGIAVIQPTIDNDAGRFVETILIHGQSNETLSCRVPLIVAKNDMQGYGSAVTYARRYGLMSMAGIAPEDDDGDAAAKAAPKAAPQTVTPEQFTTLRDTAEQADVAETVICNAYGAASFQQFPASKLDAAMKRLGLTIAEKTKPADSVTADEIPY